MDLCDECGSQIIEEQGFRVCSSCGLVQDRRIEDIEIESDSSVSSVKDSMFRDAKGNLLDEKNQYKFRKFKNYYHIPEAIKGKETDFRTMKILNEVFSRLQVPTKIRDRTLFLYHKYKSEHKKKITNHVLLSAMALLLSVRECGHNCPFTLKEIVGTYRELGHRVLGKKLLGLMQDLNIKSPKSGIRRSEDYVFRICSLICRSEAIKDRIEKQYSIDVYVYEKTLQILCLGILRRIPYVDLGGRRPYPFAAASAYVADKLVSRKIKHSSALTQKLVAQSTNVAEFTIRDNAEFLFSYDFEDLIDEIVTDYFLQYEKNRSD